MQLHAAGPSEWEHKMKTSVGFWDAMFGEKIEFDLPRPDGTTQTVIVTRRWLEEMTRQGKIQDVTTSMVKVNVLGANTKNLNECADMDDLMDALSAEAAASLVQVWDWQIGVQVSKEEYDEFVDPDSKELYALKKVEGSEVRTILVQRGLWEGGRQLMEGLG